MMSRSTLDVVFVAVVFGDGVGCHAGASVLPAPLSEFTEGHSWIAEAMR